MPCLRLVREGAFLSVAMRSCMRARGLNKKSPRSPVLREVRSAREELARIVGTFQRLKSMAC